MVDCRSYKKWAKTYKTNWTGV